MMKVAMSDSLNLAQTPLTSPIFIKKSSSVSKENSWRFMATLVKHLPVNSIFNLSSVKVVLRMGASLMQRSQSSFATSGSSCITTRYASTRSSTVRRQSSPKPTFCGKVSTHKSKLLSRSKYQKQSFCSKMSWSIWTT